MTILWVLWRICCVKLHQKLIRSILFLCSSNWSMGRSSTMGSMLAAICIQPSQVPFSTLKVRILTPRNGRKKRRKVWRIRDVSLWSFKNDDNIVVVIYSKIKFNGSDFEGGKAGPTHILYLLLFVLHSLPQWFYLREQHHHQCHMLVDPSL